MGLLDQLYLSWEPTSNNKHTVPHLARPACPVENLKT